MPAPLKAAARFLYLDDPNGRPTAGTAPFLGHACCGGGSRAPVSAVHLNVGQYRGYALRMKLREAAGTEASKVAELRSAVADALTKRFGKGHWSRVSTGRGVLAEMKDPRIFVAQQGGRLVATLRLTTRKPWAIDRSYFSASRRPLYLVSMAVAPGLQRQGIGRKCMEQIREICRRWPADAVRLDSYDAPAGAGAFYEKSGFRNVGKGKYRGCPLLYFEWLV
jgi:GNAT superfamily N-acetyltransferase